jgi:hypothetical protein
MPGWIEFPGKGGAPAFDVGVAGLRRAGRFVRFETRISESAVLG